MKRTAADVDDEEGQQPEEEEEEEEEEHQHERVRRSRSSDEHDNPKAINPRRFYSSKADLLDETPPQLQDYVRQWFAAIKAIKTPGAAIPSSFNARLVKDIWRTFGKQAEAFEYQDSRMEELHAFAFEDDSTSSYGGRKYLVTSYEGFWRHYKTLEARERHHYEVIRENMPCRLYFDLEYAEEHNGDVDGPEIVTIFKELLKEGIKTMLAAEVEHIVDLDSSTETKFSRHLIVHLRNAVFASNIHAGVFVLNWLHSLRPLDAAKLMVKDGSGLLKRFFVDDAVYTRNRTFRLFRSSKYAKQAELTTSDGYESVHAIGSLAFFKSTLVCAVGKNDEGGLRLIECELLPGAAQTRAYAVGVHQSSSRQQDGGQPSPYPQIDRYITDHIRQRHGSSTGYAYLRSATYFPEGKTIVYHIGGDKYCANVGRQHRSNHVLYVVDLRLGLFVQRCTDPECRASKFQSDPLYLPVALSPFAAQGVQMHEIDDDLILQAAELVDPSSSGTVPDEGDDRNGGDLDDSVLAAMELP